MREGHKAALAALALTLLVPASAAAQGKPYLAARAEKPRALTQDMRSARVALQRSLGAKAVLEADPATGTPRVLARLDGTLSGPSAGSPVAIADAYVRSHLSALGLTEADLATLDAPTTSTSPGGITEVRWRQSYGGVPSADSELRVNVARDGRVINLLGSPAHDLSVASTTPALDSGEAVRAVQRDAGVFRSVTRTRAGREATFSDGTRASLVLQSGRLAWQVIYSAGPGAVYATTVDATSGRVLRRVNLVKSDNNASVWDRFPGTGVGGGAHTVDLTPWLKAGATTLNGTNVLAWSDLNDAVDVAPTNTPDPGEEIGQNAGSFVWPFNPVTGIANCDAVTPCAWNQTAGQVTRNREQNGVQAFYFANRFHDHLAAAPIGFTGAEAFEGDDDRVLLETTDGGGTSGHLNNANMTTFPRGESPVMQMYLFGDQPSNNHRKINGGDDAAILYHEYTHGLSSRLITYASGEQALNSAQAGAMGEAWSDWYAMDFLVSQFPSIAPDMTPYTDFPGGGQIRSQPLDCPVAGADPVRCPGGARTGSGGYTYGDFGNVFGAPEVHADGEIWAETLWDVRTLLGSPDAEAVITLGMRFTPPEPSFLDARNGILQAAQQLVPAKLDALWGVFAARGMGYFAGAFDGGDVTPVQDFSTPPPANAPRGTITGTVRDAAGGAPLQGVTVGISGLMSGTTNLSATTAADGTYTISNVPQADYPRLIFSLPGWERVTRDVKVLGGVTTTRTALLRRNWVSINGDSAIATATSNHTEYTNIGCGPAFAIDDSLASGWSSENPDNAGSTNKASPVTLTIGLDRPITVAVVAFDPKYTCGDEPEDATGSARVETNTTTGSCSTGVGWTTRRQETFGSDLWGRLNEFPVAGATGVRCVRLSLLTSFGGASAPWRDLSEFAVYSSGPPSQPVDPVPTVVPAPTPTPTPVPTAVPTATPTPAPPVATVSIKLPSSGTKGSAPVSFSCTAQCTATATLTADKATAKKLKLTTLGKAAKAGTGSLRFTVKLSSKAIKALKKRHLKSVTVTIKVSVRMNGKTTASSKRIKIKL